MNVVFFLWGGGDLPVFISASVTDSASKLFTVRDVLFLYLYLLSVIVNLVM